MACFKSVAFLFPIFGVCFFFAILVNYGLFQLFGGLTEEQRQATIFLIVANALMLLVLPLSTFVIHQNLPGWLLGTLVQIVMIVSFVLALLSAFLFTREVSPQSMVQYFDKHFDSLGKPPAYIEYMQSVRNDCCGLSSPEDYRKFWTGNSLNVKEFSLPKSCCSIRHLEEKCATGMDPFDDGTFMKIIHQQGCAPKGVKSFPKIFRSAFFLLTKTVPRVIAFEILCVIILFNICFFCGRRRGNKRRGIQPPGQGQDSTVKELDKSKGTPNNQLATLFDDHHSLSHQSQGRGSRNSSRSKNHSANVHGHPGSSNRKMLVHNRSNVNNDSNANSKAHNYNNRDYRLQQIQSLGDDDELIFHQGDRDTLASNSIQGNLAGSQSASITLMNPLIEPSQVHDEASVDCLHNLSM